MLILDRLQYRAFVRALNMPLNCNSCNLNQRFWYYTSFRSNSRIICELLTRFGSFSCSVSVLGGTISLALIAIPFATFELGVPNVFGIYVITNMQSCKFASNE